MRAILLGPVRTPDRIQKRLFSSLKIQGSDLLIGVDGGTQIWKRWGFKPHFAVGDWDSLQGQLKVLSDVPHLTLSRTKDRSDLFYAARVAIEMGASELLCLGVSGGRVDHQLAMIYDLSDFSTGRYGRLTRVQAIGPEGDYFFLSSAIPSWKMSNSRKGVCSIFAVQGEATGVTLSGFEYNLEDAILTPSSHGLSNRKRRRDCEVSLRKGQLLVIMLRGGLNAG